MVKKYIVAFGLFVLFLTCHGYAQIQWPAITQTAKPWTRWWWQGSAVNKKNLTAAMKKYALAGLGGLEITPIYGIKGYETQFINYLSPQWVNMLQYTLQEAKKLQLGIDMATGTGWPFGGPWVTAEDASKYIACKTYVLKSGEQLKDTIAYVQEPIIRTANGKQAALEQIIEPIGANKNLQALALDQVRFIKPLPLQLLMAYDEKGTATDITNKVNANGKLDWTAPVGSSYTLYALFQGWHGKMVERAAPGGEGLAIDHFSGNALKNYLSKFDKSFAGKNISGLRCFFNDSYEVDDAKGQANWTPDFLNAFKQKRGYNLGNELPALYQKDNADKNSRVLYDYRQTVSELLLEKFTMPWHHWGQAKGKIIRNQSHGSPANILDLYAAIDIPETEGLDVLRFKFATSAAHVMGKPLASAEAATWLNEHFQSSLADVKQAIDKYFTGGVNHIFYHGTNYSPQGEVWPGWLFYAAVHFTPANSFWNNFSTLNNYVARCQSFLQKGKANNDVLLYFPFSDKIAEPGNTLLYHFDGMEGFDNTNFKTSATYLLNQGYAFDLISDRQIQQVTAINKLLQTGNIQYQTLLFADTKYLPLPTMEKLFQLAKDGATIIFHKNLPMDVPGLNNLIARQAAFKNIVAQLDFKQTGNISIATIGNGRVIMGNDLQALLAFSKIRRETMVDDGLQYVRRQYATGNYYFISNTSNKPFAGNIMLQTKAANVVLFNAMTGVSGIAKKQNNENTVIYLDLQPGESIIAQTSQTKINGNNFLYSSAKGEAREIKGVWKINFISGGPILPAATELTKLISWTELPDTDVKNFSGMAQYSIRFNKPKDTCAAWQLNLGTVTETAEVLLNGKKIATLIGTHYHLIISDAQLKEDNLLQINVTNGMANRIADLDRRNVEWKKFYNINFPARLPENKGADGLFTAAQWQPKQSGLLGPVTLTPVIFVNK